MGINAVILYLQVKSSGLKKMCDGKDAAVAATKRENVALQRALFDERQRVSSLNEKCATLKGSLEGKTEEFQSLQAHITTLQVYLKYFFMPYVVMSLF